MPLACLVAVLLRGSEETLLLHHEAAKSDGATVPRCQESNSCAAAHLVPMNNPLPIARQIPTILNEELLLVLTSPAAELEAAAAEAVELATVLDMARKRGDGIGGKCRRASRVGHWHSGVAREWDWADRTVVTKQDCPRGCRWSS